MGGLIKITSDTDLELDTSCKGGECNIVAKWSVRNVLVSSLECEGLATPRVKVRSKTIMGKE